MRDNGSLLAFVGGAGFVLGAGLALLWSSSRKERLSAPAAVTSGSPDPQQARSGAAGVFCVRDFVKDEVENAVVRCRSDAHGKLAASDLLTATTDLQLQEYSKRCFSPFANLPCSTCGTHFAVPRTAGSDRAAHKKHTILHG
jgi:hypothetical protein